MHILKLVSEMYLQIYFVYSYDGAGGKISLLAIGWVFLFIVNTAQNCFCYTKIGEVQEVWNGTIFD